MTSILTVTVRVVSQPEASDGSYSGQDQAGGFEFDTSKMTEANHLTVSASVSRVSGGRLAEKLGVMPDWSAAGNGPPLVYKVPFET